MSKRKLVVGNWKMNPENLDDAKRIASAISRSVKNLKTKVVLCPPFVFLGSLSGIRGAQDVFYESSGAFTGEVSPAQLASVGVEYVIVGHSERRALGETNEIVNKKVRAVLENGMTAIVCAGEKVRDHGGEYLHEIKAQITHALKDVNKRYVSNIVIAYEPVWKIGQREAMSPVEIHEMSIYIRKILHDLYASMAEDVKIIYGGSVMADDADRIVGEGNVSGLLVGRESLKPKEFVEIVRLVDSV